MSAPETNALSPAPASRTTTDIRIFFEVLEDRGIASHMSSDTAARSGLLNTIQPIAPSFFSINRSVTRSRPSPAALLFRLC
jgi:hypothetical protein